MSYPNIYRQSPSLISTIWKVKSILTKGIKHKNTLAVLRHEGTNYDVLTTPEKLNEFKSHLSDYFTFGEEYLQTLIKNIVNEQLTLQLVTLKAEAEENLDEQFLLYQYKSFEDSAVESELNILKATVKQINLVIEELKAENIALALRVTELETLTNELLVGSAEDKSNIKSLEIRSSDLEVSNNELKNNIAQLFALVELDRNVINDSKEVISEQKVQIGSLINTVETQQVEINDLINTVEIQRVEINDLINTVEIQQVEIKDLETKVKHLEEQVSNLTARMNTLEECQAITAKNMAYVIEQLALHKGQSLSIDLRKEIVNSIATISGQCLATFTSLSYAQAPIKQLQAWFEVLKTFKDYLVYLAQNYGFKPIYQLQMVNSLTQEYHTRYAVKH